MNDWNSGYTTDIDYTFGYYPELNPARIRLAFLDAGLVCPEVGTACELGFGQGVSLNVHAAASVTRWSGTDFNPAQAAFARELGAASETEIRIRDDAFAEFARRDDLPDFDFIALHGIWSWISDENRASIVDFVRRKLKVGGVLYVSYNTLPGWAAFAPMRHLLALHAEVLGAPGQGPLGRVGDALAFADAVLAARPLYASMNPSVAGRIERMKAQNPRYLVHEFFNRHWEPMYFSEVSAQLAAAKLTFACSASFNDHVRALNLTTDQQSVLDSFKDPVLRESVRDYMVNQQFRKDYWVRGARRLTALERAEGLRAQRVVLISARKDIALRFSGALKVEVNEALYGTLLDAVADHAPRSLGEIERTVQGRLGFAQVLEATMLLIGAGHLAVAQSPEEAEAVRARTDRLNAHLLGRARASADIHYLASPVTGGAIGAPRTHQLFLLAIQAGFKSTDQWAQFAWRLVSAQGGRMTRDGRPLETAQENLAELGSLARAFESGRLPVLRALGVA